MTAPPDEPPELPRPRDSALMSAPPGSELWVFAYGSLMWHPGFACQESHLARLRGYHRRFCLYSYRYRGTPQRPGLVLGLDRGGSCLGMAFRVGAADAESVLDYLWAREMVTYAYQPRLLPVRLVTGEVRRVWTFVVDRRHRQYCGALSPDAAVAMIRGGRGLNGSNLDYLTNTVRHLEKLGIIDAPLEALLVRARAAADPPDKALEALTLAAPERN